MGSELFKIELSVQIHFYSATNSANVFYEAGTGGANENWLVTSAVVNSLKTIDLSAYDGLPEVYIAFVMAQDDGDNWYIDDANVTGTLGTNNFDRKSMLAFYPNPSAGSVKISNDCERKRSYLQRAWKSCFVGQRKKF